MVNGKGGDSVISWLKNTVLEYYITSVEFSNDCAARYVVETNPTRLLDVGYGDGSRLLRYLQERPKVLCGVKGNRELASKAARNGLDVESFDLNGKWPYEDKSFDVVHGNHVIEHVHNTRLFLSETHRVLVPGGLMVMASENLCSLLNLSAMLLGYTPFSLQNVCGWYLGNPLGLHAGEDFSDHAKLELPGVDAPLFSGAAGHNRVLSFPMAKDFLEKIGFADIEIKSVGLMPFPGWLGKFCEKFMPRRGHWLLMKALRPFGSDGGRLDVLVGGFPIYQPHL